MRELHLAVAVALVATLCATAARAQDATVLPELHSVESAALNLLVDPGFEDPESGAWRFTDWPPRPETGDRLIADSVLYTAEQAWEGEHAIVFDLTTIGADRTLIAQQRIDPELLAPHDGQRMRLAASILLAGGPTAQRVMMTIRQWGESGPPIDHHSMRMTADVNDWTHWIIEFTFRMGETRRADVNVTIGQSPDLTNSPVVFVDDVRLEVLQEPTLDATLLSGSTFMTPDDGLPVEVTVSAQAWRDGLRALRWDLTTPDGLTGFTGNAVEPSGRTFVLEVPVHQLSEGRYAVRLALGHEPGERLHEVLLPFRRAEGPFAH